MTCRTLLSGAFLVAAWPASCQTTCAQFPARIIPFAKIYYVRGSSSGSLVVGDPGGAAGYTILRDSLPMQSAPSSSPLGQPFCNARIELAPGEFFSNVYVPTVRERMGDYSQTIDNSGRFMILYDPFSPDPNQMYPFPGNIVPASRLSTIFAFKVAGLPNYRRPSIQAGGVANAAGPTTAAAVAPGTLISIYGTELAAEAVAATVDNGRLPITLGPTEVRLDGVALPLLYVSPGQINAQVPYNVAPGARRLTVNRMGVASGAETVEVAATAPAVFTGAFLKNADYSLVSAANPARPGEVLLVYCTGLGMVNPAPVANAVTPSSPLSSVAAAVRVTIGGIEAQVANAVLAPGFLGLYQVGIVIPPGLPAGEAPLVVSAGGVSSMPKSLPTAN